MRRIGSRTINCSATTALTAVCAPSTAAEALTSSTALTTTSPAKRSYTTSALFFSNGNSSVSTQNYICCRRNLRHQFRSYTSLEGAKVLVGGESKDTIDVCVPIYERLPEDGSYVSAAEFAAIVDEILPMRSYNAIGLYTVREVAEACPSLFKVEPDLETGWFSVARNEYYSRTSSSSSSKTPSNLATAEDRKKQRKDASKYVSVKGPELVPLEDVLTAEATDVPMDAILRYVHTNTSFKVRTKITIQPKARPHGAHVFIDGDGLSKEVVGQLFATLKLTSVASTRTVARLAGSLSHSPNDVVVKSPAQTFQILENQIELLSAGSAVLKPIVIMCSEAQKSIYADVARHFAAKGLNVMLATPCTVGHLDPILLK